MVMVALRLMMPLSAGSLSGEHIKVIHDTATQCPKQAHNERHTLHTPEKGLASVSVCGGGLASFAHLKHISVRARAHQTAWRCGFNGMRAREGHDVLWDPRRRQRLIKLADYSHAVRAFTPWPHKLAKLNVCIQYTHTCYIRSFSPRVYCRLTYGDFGGGDGKTPATL